MEINVIYNDDCFNVIEKLDDKSIDLVLTDPPYLFNKEECKKQYENTNSKFAKSDLYNNYGEMMVDFNNFGEEEINRFCSMLPRVMKKMNAYIFCSEAQVRLYGNWAENNGYKFSILVWEKPLSIISKNRFSQNAEFLVRIYDLGTGLNTIKMNDYYNRVIHTNVEKSKEHPTQKPIEMMARYILLSSNEGDVILDPFMGSGTTIVSAIQNNRRYIGIELKEKYYNIAKERIEHTKIVNDISLF